MDSNSSAQASNANGGNSKRQKKKEKLKKRKEEKLKKKLKKSKDAASTASKSGESADVVRGYCDVCQMDENYNKKVMKLWQCQRCNVKVHDACYGASDNKRGRPNPRFVCHACQSVGKEFKVRDIDPFTKEYLNIKQKERPKECCLCSIEDGIHAMHPVYDAHGTKGRQIYLPADEGKPRRLAWAHTLCALSVNWSHETKGTMYGCASNGFYSDDDLECDLLSDSESVNSDLDRKGIRTGVHHFVYWGYLFSFLNKDDSHDDWAKSITHVKEELKCSFCGKADNEITTLPGGQTVYRALRVPLQCSANNEDEHPDFKSCHAADDNCFVAMHVGCAIWGKNEHGEYNRAKGSWFYPGSKSLNPVTEVYCRTHALDLFRNKELNRWSDMAIRHPRHRFIPIQGSPRKSISSTKRKASTTDSTSGRPLKRTNQASPASLVSSKPRALPVSTKTGLKKKTSNLKKAPAAVTASRSPPQRAGPIVSLHGETRKKRARELKTAGEAVLIQSKKHGRLVSKRHNSATSQGIAPAAQDIEHVTESDEYLNMVHQILNVLIQRQQECRREGKAFDASVTAKLRIQLLNRFEGSNDFTKAWRRANVSFKEGIVDVTFSKESEGEPGKAATMPEALGAKRSEEAGFDRETGSGVPVQETVSDGPGSGRAPTFENDLSVSEASHRSGRDLVASGRTGEHSDSHNDGTSGQGTVDSPPLPAVRKNPEPSLDNQCEEATENSQDVATASSFVDGQMALVDEIANDVIQALKPYNAMDDDNEEKNPGVHKVLKARKKYWKNQSGLSKKDFRVLFNVKVAKKISKHYDWLKIDVKSQSTEPGESGKEPGGGLEPSTSNQEEAVETIGDHVLEPTVAPAASLSNQGARQLLVESRPQAELADERTASVVFEQHANDPGAADNSTEYSGNAAPSRADTDDQPSSQNESDEESRSKSPSQSNTIPLDNYSPQPQQYQPMNFQPPVAPPNRWSHLFYGPHYRKEGFQFGEWDTYQEISSDQLSLG